MSLLENKFIQFSQLVTQIKLIIRDFFQLLDTIKG